MENIDVPPQAGKQVIPRPPESRLGSPAPWAGLPAERRRGITLDHVRRVLVATGRPTVVHPWISTPPTVGGTPPTARQAAAVLVPLFEEDGETRVILTVRSDQLRSHTGEVAFPGGRLDGDEGVVSGALREAYEEAGIEPGSVDVIGELTVMPTVSSDSVVTPVVGTLASRPEVHANPGEVERVFDVSLADLVADGVFHEERWLRAVAPEPGAAAGDTFRELRIWFFDLAGETVWGATAWCLTQLLCLVLDVPFPPSQGP
jgi:8-oxo-dGTP pyrophosphatase MutT (NUDIX family)